MKNGNVANGNGGLKKDERESYKEVYKRVFLQHKTLIFVILLVVLITILGVIIGVSLKGDSSQRDSSALSENLRLQSFRLPSNIVPLHYVIEMKTFLSPNNFKFEGNEQISLECMQKTNRIVFHSLNLTIDEDSIKVLTENNNDIGITGVKHLPHIHLVTIELDQYLNVNNTYRLSLNFSGIMLQDGKGMYYSTYEDRQNKVNYLAATQFEPIYARKAFPCFDEPAMKAKFDIRLVRWKNMTSLSNMPKLNTVSLENEWEMDIYQTSMKMSTYLVVFVIGNFTKRTNEEISVLAHPQEIGLADYSLSLTPKLLKYFQDLFQVPYEAPKLDMVGIKSDNVIAMENWGLVVYPEYQLLYDEKSKSQRKKELIASTISHELAHQWFGNLVTPKWWSHIWLNEGLSTYMEQVASGSFFPEWNKIDKTIRKVNNKVVENQCSAHSKYGGRVAMKIDTFQDVNSRDYFFSSDIYNKGAMIIRMAHHILGNETFWKGINKYLKENAYSNVDEKTLWKSLTMAQPSFKNPKENLMSRMTPWTNLLGQPIVHVERNYEGRRAFLSQVSCLAKKNKMHKNDLWPIPISYVTQDHWEWNPRITTWLTTRNMILQDMPKKQEWILVNGNGIGLYIVNYDKKNWRLLAKQLQSNHQVFSALNRFKLLNDAVVLYKLEYIEFATLLDIYAYIGLETELMVLKLENMIPLFDFTHVMQHMTEENKWKDFMNYILEPIYNRLGWTIKTEFEHHTVASLRKRLFGYLCENGHEDCLNNTVDLFTNWKTNRTAIDPAQLDLLNLCAIIKYGSRYDWNFIHDLYLETRNQYFLSPLTCTKDRGLFKRLLGVFLRENERLPAHFIEIVFKNIFENENLWIEFFNFLDDHFKRITDIYQLEDLMSYMNTFLENEIIFNQFESIFGNHMEEISQAKVMKIKDKLAKCKEKVLKRNKEIYSLRRWLKRESWLRNELP